MLDIRTDKTINVIDNQAKQFASDLIKYCYQGNLLQLKELVALGADVNVPDENGELVLHSSIRAGYDEITSFLLSVNANPNLLDLSGNDAMYYAAMKNNISVAKELFNESAFVDGQKDGMVPPLITAALYNCGEVVEFLISKGAVVDIKDKKGKTALYYATAQKHQNVIEMLLKAGATPVKLNNKVNSKKPAWKRFFNF